MSQRQAGSRSSVIDDVMVSQDMVSSERIYDVLLLEQIDLATNDRGKLVLSLSDLPEIPVSVIAKDNQKINVAVGSKIVAQNRTKERQLAHFPFLAKCV